MRLIANIFISIFLVLLVSLYNPTSLLSKEALDINLRGQTIEKSKLKKIKIDSRFSKLAKAKVLQATDKKEKKFRGITTLLSSEANLRGSKKNVYKEIANSVVLIDRWINKNEKWEFDGSGAGIVFVSADRSADEVFTFIITNWHVINKADGLNVCFKPPGKRIGKIDCENGAVAEVVSYTIEKDLAIIAIQTDKDFKEVQFADYGALDIGDKAYAIGHPNELFWTLTEGSISQIRDNFDWTIEGYTHRASVVQTQTPINPGNSGGPLLNENAELIGINTWTDEGENLNFAIAVNEVSNFLSDVINNKSDNLNIDAFKQDDTEHIRNLIECESFCEALDDNKNNIADTYLMDKDENGINDHMIVDDNEDGIIDSVAMDENENGILEKIVMDTDYDGIPDKVFIDEDEDKNFDRVGYDYDQDGEMDEWKPYKVG